MFVPCESSGGWLSQHSWQSSAAPASPGAFAHVDVVPPLLEPLLVLLPLLLVLPLLDVLPLLLVLPPLLDVLLPLLLDVLLPELLLDVLLPASLLKPGVVAVLEQPLM